MTTAGEAQLVAARRVPEADDLPEVLIASHTPHRWRHLAAEIWQYRALLFTLATRDLKTRHMQTALGTAGLVLQPLLTSGVLAIAVRHLGLGGAIGGVHSFLFFLAGLLPWNTFSSAVMKATSSIDQNGSLVRKVYFPRLILPIAYVLASAINYVVIFAAFLVLAAATGAPTSGLVTWMPVLLPLQLLTAAGIGCACSVINAQFRDTQYIVSFALSLGMFITVLVPLPQWPAWAQLLLSLSPMTAVVATYRGALAGAPADWLLLFRGAAVAAALFAAGAWCFQRRAPQVLDLL